MGKEYLSRSDKEAFMQALVAQTVLCDCICSRAVFQPYREQMQKISDDLQDILREVGNLVDRDTARALKNIADGCAIRVYPRHNVTGEKQQLLVDRDSIAELLEDTITDCTLCDKKGFEAKKCHKKKLLLNCMIFGDDTQKNCPYQGIIEF